MAKKFVIDGKAAKKQRTDWGMNQHDFWALLGVTQSGGSRYESGRKMPRPLQRLYFLTFNTHGMTSLLSPTEKKQFFSL